MVSTSRCGLCSYSAERTQVRFLVIPFFALPDDSKPNHWSRMPDTPVESNCVHCRLDAKGPVPPEQIDRQGHVWEMEEFLKPPVLWTYAELLGPGQTRGSHTKQWLMFCSSSPH